MIKSLFKTENNKSTISSWILSNFPESYEKYTYLEPYVGNGSILLNKEISSEEVVGDLDDSIIESWKLLKDENRILKSRLSKINYNKKHFNLILNSKTKNELEKRINDFILKLMSKNGKSLEFQELEKNKSKIFFNNVIKDAEVISKKIENVYFIKKDPLEIIINFDNSNAFCYCCPPKFDEKKSNIDLYVNLTDAIKNFRGKVLFLGNNCKFYKRVFNDWNLIKKNNKLKDYIWTNF